MDELWHNQSMLRMLKNIKNKPNLGPQAPYNAFFALTGGITFVAFAASFGPCLFNLDTVGTCVENARGWVDVLRGVGDHIIAWGTALVRAAFAA